MRRIGNKERKVAPRDWRERASEILTGLFSQASESEIEEFVGEHWQNLAADTTNVEAFMRTLCNDRGLEDFDKLIWEFNDDLNSDPHFNYKPSEFPQWFDDWVLQEDEFWKEQFKNE